MKFAEIILRRTFQNAKVSSISAQPPDKYAQRFYKFFEKNVFIDKFGTGISQNIKDSYIDYETKKTIRMSKKLSTFTPANSSNHTLNNLNASNDDFCFPGENQEDLRETSVFVFPVSKPQNYSVRGYNHL